MYVFSYTIFIRLDAVYSNYISDKCIVHPHIKTSSILQKLSKFDEFGINNKTLTTCRVKEKCLIECGKYLVHRSMDSTVTICVRSDKIFSTKVIFSIFLKSVKS